MSPPCYNGADSAGWRCVLLRFSRLKRNHSQPWLCSFFSLLFPCQSSLWGKREIKYILHLKQIKTWVDLSRYFEIPLLHMPSDSSVGVLVLYSLLCLGSPGENTSSLLCVHKIPLYWLDAQFPQHSLYFVVGVENSQGLSSSQCMISQI